METKDNLIGFIWYKTPIMSSFLLKKQISDVVPFEHMCKDFMDSFKKNYDESQKQIQDDTECLKKLGCSKIVIVPEPIGNIRIELFKKFISEIEENSFIYVKSFAGFGHHSTLVHCLKLALSKKIYVITEQHKSLTLLPNDVVSEVYENWVMKQNTYTRYRKDESKAEKALYLINNGLTYAQAQEEMGVSRSTFYRLIAKRKKRDIFE